MDVTMPKLEWDESYSVGVPTMDADDKQVFAYINELCDSMMGKTDKKQVGDTLISILNFTIGHMLKEEVMLQKNEYPMLGKHVEDHERYLREIRGLYVRFFSGKEDSRIMSAEVIAVLTDLLQEHIMKADKQYGEFFKQKSSTLGSCKTTIA
jgi:hemerythrin